jgi:phosphohistidine phosphatase SixA
MAATKIYLVRHAHADWAADESRPLSKSGLAAAERIAWFYNCRRVLAC